MQKSELNEMNLFSIKNVYRGKQTEQILLKFKCKTFILFNHLVITISLLFVNTLYILLECKKSMDIDRA